MKPNTPVKVEYKGYYGTWFKGEGIYLGSKGRRNFVEVSEGLIMDFPTSSFKELNAVKKPRRKAIKKLTEEQNELVKIEALGMLICQLDETRPTKAGKIQLFDDLMYGADSLQSYEVWEPFEGVDDDNLRERLEEFYHQFRRFALTMLNTHKETP